MTSRPGVDPPANAPEPMRVFVGTDESQFVATKVLEYSIRKHATGPVEFHRMTAAGMPLPRDKKNRPRTGFSFCRLTIPERCGHRGRALYLDADMLVFADLAELWQIPFGEQSVLCTWQSEPPPDWRDNPAFHTGRHYAVMLLDCGRLPWDIKEIIRGLDEDRYTYQQLMYDLCIVAPAAIDHRVPTEWNSLELYEPGRTKNIHYTVVPTQPWRCRTNPHGAIWDEHLAEAVRAGIVTRDDIDRGVAKGHLHADLRRFAPRPAAGGVPRDCGILFFLQLVTDVDLLEPLIHEAQRRPGVTARLVVDAALLERLPRVAGVLAARGLAFTAIALGDIDGGKAPDWSGIRAVVTATESTARPHAAAHALVRRAQRRGLPCFTLQHGFENVGITWFDHVHTPAATRFRSDRILTWGPLALLHPRVLADTRARCVPIGCTKEKACSPGRQTRPSERPHFVAVYENLHWHRFDPTYREQFLKDLEAAARALPDTTWFVRPHPSGAWLTGRHRGPLPQTQNLVIADPANPAWDEWTTAEVFALADLVLTTPSTVALDAARVGCPVGVIAYQQEVAAYAPLPLVRQGEDWTTLALQARTPDGRRALVAPAEAFVQRVLVPGNAAARAIDLVVQDAARPRPVSAAHRLAVAVRNKLFGG